MELMDWEHRIELWVTIGAPFACALWTGFRWVQSRLDRLDKKNRSQMGKRPNA